jgi:hypothetical protein
MLCAAKLDSTVRDFRMFAEAYHDDAEDQALRISTEQVPMDLHRLD